MQFLVKVSGELRVFTLFRCEDGNVYVMYKNNGFIELVDESITGTPDELRWLAKTYCTVNCYTLIGEITSPV